MVSIMYRVFLPPLLCLFLLGTADFLVNWDDAGNQAVDGHIENQAITGIAGATGGEETGVQDSVDTISPNVVPAVESAGDMPDASDETQNFGKEMTVSIDSSVTGIGVHSGLDISGSVDDLLAVNGELVSDRSPVPMENERKNETDSIQPSKPSVSVAVKIDHIEADVVTDSPVENIPTSVTIPELSWPDSTRNRRPLSREIIEQYPGGNFVPRKVANSAWGVGERLTFSLDYSFYTAGTATMTVESKEQANGALCYRIYSTAESNEFISKFYTVRDNVNSYIDVEGLFSRRFEKELREGNYESDRYVDFYHDRLIALNTKKSYAVRVIPLYIQDILSSLYLIRTFDLRVGKKETVEVYADGKVYPLIVEVHKIEEIKVPAGTFRCFLIEPILKSEGIFRQKGKLNIWLTNDQRKLPVKMTSKVVIGSFAANLRAYVPGVIE